MGGGLWWAVGKHVRRLTLGLGLPNGLTLYPASSVERTSRLRESPWAVQWEIRIFTKTGGGTAPIREESWGKWGRWKGKSRAVA